MTALSTAEVRDFVVAALDEPLRDAGMEPADADDQLDLIRAGLVDSLGFLELIAQVEERFGLEIDFEGLDAESLTKIGSFARYVASQAKAEAA